MGYRVNLIESYAREVRQEQRRNRLVIIISVNIQLIAIALILITTICAGLWLVQPIAESRTGAARIETIAGNDAPGFNGDGLHAEAARLNHPLGIALDRSANLYIADEFNNRIRRIDAETGEITTVAGNGSFAFGGDGGPAVEASLAHPAAVAIDSSGNLLISDSLNNRIRRVDAETLRISTIAGTGVAGFSGDGGLASSAALNNPIGIAIDSSGNILIADSGNHRIRRIDARTGEITTVAGNGRAELSGDGGPAVQASLNFPLGVAVDARGNIYIADSRNSRIRRVDADRLITTVARGGQSKLNRPSSVAVDPSGNLFIADTLNNRIQKIDISTGQTSTFVGTGIAGFGGDGFPAMDAKLFEPQSVAIDAAGNLFIADTRNNRVRRAFLPGRPPRAKIIAPLTVEQTDPWGATISLDGSASVDPDSIPGVNNDIVLYQWDLNSDDRIDATGAKVESRFAPGASQVTLIVTDSRGLTGVAKTTITVRDTTAPSLIIPGDITVEREQSNGTAAGSSALAGFFSQARAVDTVDPRVMLRHNAPSVFPLGKTAVTFSARDASGNEAHATATVTVVDTRPPALSIPADVVIEQESPEGATLSLTASATDLPGSNVVVTSDAPKIFPPGTTVVTFTATDDAGNTTSGMTRVIVRDSTPPVLSVGDDIVVEATGWQTPVVIPAPVVFDMCDPHPAVTGDAPATFPLGKTAVTFTATDAAGNKTTRRLNVIVRDAVAPTIEIAPKIEVEATGPRTIVELPMPKVKDNADPSPKIASDAPAAFPIGSTVVTFTATDSSGNKSHARTTVTVIDTAAPVIEIESTLVFEATGEKTPVCLPAPRVFDEVDPNPTVVSDAPDSFPLGSTVVTFTATDRSGNTTKTGTLVTLIDRTPPTIEAVPDITVAARGVKTYVNIPLPAVKDNVDPSPQIYSNAASVFPLGATVVTFTATDRAGNSSTRSMTVNVVDKTPPVISARELVTVEQEGPEGSRVALSATAVDELDEDVCVTSNAPAIFPPGKTVVTFTASDSTGNRSTATTTVVVVDTTPPVIDVGPDITVISESAAGASVKLPVPVVYDACDPNPTVTNDAPSIFPPGPTRVTFTATDRSGNKATSSITVFVRYNVGGSLPPRSARSKTAPTFD